MNAITLNKNNYPQPRQSSQLLLLTNSLRTVWQPIPIAKPEIDSSLTSLSAMERVAEVLRFSFMSIEYAVSPNGGVRAWLKLNLLICLMLLAPALLVFPVITWFLVTFTTWTEYLYLIAKNILYFFLLVSASVAVIISTHFAVKTYLKKQSEKRNNSKKN